MGNRVASLSLIMEGVEYFRMGWEGYNSDIRKELKTTGLEGLIAEAIGLKSAVNLDELPQNIRNVVQKSIKTFKDKPMAARKALPNGGEEPEWSPSELTSQRIDINLSRLDFLTWILWWLVAIVVGWAVLILNDPGFGTTLDLVKAFLWGLGAHVAGASLQSLTPSTIMTSFNVAFPSAKK